MIGLVCSLESMSQPEAGDELSLAGPRTNPRARCAIGLTPPLGSRCVKQVLELGEVVEPEQLLRDMRLLALALDRGQALDDVRQHLLDGALAAIHLFDHVHRLEGFGQWLGLYALRH